MTALEKAARRFLTGRCRHYSKLNDCLGMEDPNRCEQCELRAALAGDALVEALARLTRVAAVELTGKRDDVLEQARAALKAAGVTP